MFCINCGTRLSDGAGFCTSCGTKIEAQPAYATKPSAPHTAPVPVPAPVSALTDSCVVNEGRMRKKGWMIFMLIVSVVLVFIGAGHVALAVVGRTVTAHVSGYEQVLILNNDDSTRNPSRYKLDYQFAVKGEQYTGSVARIFTGGRHMVKTIQVRYLPFWPHVNSEDSSGVNPVGPVVIGLGIVVFVLAVRKKSQVG